jgi:uncharacterized iron-regulated membrane protein
MHSLHKRSFGIIMLLLALVAIAPGVSIVSGLLLTIPAFHRADGRIDDRVGDSARREMDHQPLW